MSKPHVLVVTGILLDDSFRMLVQQRPPGKDYAGLWETPGGKVEPGEDPRSAISRELREELGLVIPRTRFHPWGFQVCELPACQLTMLAFVAPVWSGKPHGMEGQTLDWATPLTLDQFTMTPGSTNLLGFYRSAMRT